MRRIMVPCCRRANNQLNSAVRAPPTCKYPVGDGANRTRTLPGAYFGSLELVDMRLVNLSYWLRSGIPMLGLPVWPDRYTLKSMKRQFILSEQRAEGERSG